MYDMYYYSSAPRTTLDNEWTEEELSGDVYDECVKLLPEYEQKYSNRAVYDKDLFKPAYLAEKITSENDLIEVYNKEYDKHRDQNMFGIVWFDKWIASTIRKIMNDNLVGGIK